MQTVQWCARAQLGPSLLLNGPLRIRCQFIYEWPKSWPHKKLREGGACWKTSRPDADNLLKLIKDSLTGVVYHDDAQIFHVEAIKLYGTRSHTVVTIWEGAGP
jgi:Holliday junction resolvase RusA-like endonuclease